MDDCIFDDGSSTCSSQSNKSEIIEIQDDLNTKCCSETMKLLNKINKSPIPNFGKMDDYATILNKINKINSEQKKILNNGVHDIELYASTLENFTNLFKDLNKKLSEDCNNDTISLILNKLRKPIKKIVYYMNMINQFKSNVNKFNNNCNFFYSISNDINIFKSKVELINCNLNNLLNKPKTEKNNENKLQLQEINKTLNMLESYDKNKINNDCNKFIKINPSIDIICKKSSNKCKHKHVMINCKNKCKKSSKNCKNKCETQLKKLSNTKCKKHIEKISSINSAHKCKKRTKKLNNINDINKSK